MTCENSHRTLLYKHLHSFHSLAGELVSPTPGICTILLGHALSLCSTEKFLPGECAERRKEMVSNPKSVLCPYWTIYPSSHPQVKIQPLLEHAHAVES